MQLPLIIGKTVQRKFSIGDSNVYIRLIFLYFKEVSMHT